jgi:hypothetical protein
MALQVLERRGSDFNLFIFFALTKFRCTAGKTLETNLIELTFVECVADLIKRPLLPLTCGDMGVTASEVEKNFNLFFELGERWGAVVLMDEADIYLEQRTSENLERNSLVSGIYSNIYIAAVAN